VRLFIYLTPFVPLSMIWRCILSMRGEDIKKRGFAPLRHPLLGWWMLVSLGLIKL